MAVVDLRLPEMNGIDVIKALKEILPDIKIVIYTGYYDDFKHRFHEIDFPSFFNKGQDAYFEMGNHVRSLLGLKPVNTDPDAGGTNNPLSPETSALVPYKKHEVVPYKGKQEGSK